MHGRIRDVWSLPARDPRIVSVEILWLVVFAWHPTVVRSVDEGSSEAQSSEINAEPCLRLPRYAGLITARWPRRSNIQDSNSRSPLHISSSSSTLRTLRCTLNNPFKNNIRPLPGPLASPTRARQQHHIWISSNQPSRLPSRRAAPSPSR